MQLTIYSTHYTGFPDSIGLVTSELVTSELVTSELVTSELVTSELVTIVESLKGLKTITGEE
jgi:hypothetical protein